MSRVILTALLVLLCTACRTNEPDSDATPDSGPPSSIVQSTALHTDDSAAPVFGEARSRQS